MTDKQQQWLNIYVSPDDANLSKIEFLSVVALRIRDDLDAIMCGGTGDSKTKAEGRGAGPRFSAVPLHSIKSVVHHFIKRKNHHGH
jgi:hypothetical protein